MNSARKFIWTLYILLWVYFLFFDSSYEKDSHISIFLIIGWIPFLILHFLWKNKSQKSYTRITTESSENSSELKKARKLRDDNIISEEEFEKIKHKILNS